MTARVQISNTKARKYLFYGWGTVHSCIFSLLFGVNCGKHNKKQSHSSQQHSNPRFPFSRQTPGSPGVRSMPVTSIVFFCIFLLIYPPIGIKKVRNRSHAPKNANPDCCYTKPDNWDIGYPTYHLLEFAFLPNSKSGMPKKGIISPLKRPLSHKSIIWFCVANLLYHRICKTSSGWVKKIICIK